MTQLAGIDVRHRTTCGSHAGGKCNCKPAYQASVWGAREEKRLRKTFSTLAAARAWRAEAQTAIRRGTMRASIALTVREAGDELVEGCARAASGLVRATATSRVRSAATRRRSATGSSRS